MKQTISSRSIVVLTITALVILSAATAVPIAADDGPKPVPHSFHGEVHVGDDPAPAGTEIVAMIDGEERGDIVTEQEGMYGEAVIGGEKLAVEGETGDDGAVITFLVDGEEADQTAIWQEQTNTELNLTVGGDGGDDEYVSVTTGEATDVTESTATLTGDLTELEGADDATVHFEYGPGDDRSQETTSETVTSGDSFEHEVTGLEADTEYTFQAVAETDGADDAGDVVTFATDSDNWDDENITVTTGDATDLDDSSATLTGELIELEEAENATVHFEYGPGGELTNETPAQSIEEGNDFDAELTGLEADTEYSFKAIAQTDDAASAGDVVTFTTDSHNWDDENISVTTGEAIDVGETTATLTGNLTELVNADSASVHFEYGPDGELTNETPAQSVEAGDSFDHEVTDLEADTEYSFKAIAETDDAAGAGEMMTFATDEGEDGGSAPPAPPAPPGPGDDEDEDETDSSDDDDETDAGDESDDEGADDDEDAGADDDEEEDGSDDEGTDDDDANWDDDDDEDEDDNDDGMPGFGAIGALLGLLMVAALAGRRL